ncbi:hypothetical protein [Halobacterium sp. R2-5]|nr:hypothetical protein [Halobacterium sp. R2-5]
MAHRITEADQQRIAEFANTPKYQRGPHLLEPDDGDDLDDD